MLNLKLIYKIIGTLLFIEVPMMLWCLGMSFYYGEDDSLAFIVSIILTVLGGVFFKYIGRDAGNSLGRRDSYLLVTATWIIFSFFGAFPFMISGYITNFTDAFFETISGFTTTGCSILDDVEVLPHGLLFWRTMTQWIGGLGIVFFTLTLIPNNFQSGLKLFSAEASSLSHEKIHPRMRTTAKWLWSMYGALTLMCAISLWLAGMTPFDSINFAMSTLSTGGFAPHQAGVMVYHSPLIEYLLICFMFVGGTNFIAIYLLFKQRNIRLLTHNEEFRLYVASVVSVSALCTACLVKFKGLDWLEALRTALFNVVSIQTTTGFVSSDFSQWYHPLVFVLTMVMVTGACSGSTSGGVKGIRIVLLFKSAVAQFKRLLHPNAVIPVRLNHQPVSESTIIILMAYFFWYVVLLVVGAVLVDISGVAPTDSLPIAITCFSNVGPSLGTHYGPLADLSSLPAMAKWVCSFLMLAGRLEIFCVLLPLTSVFWQRD